ncbi:hypothetical protein PHYSODRAFT_317582 [Phytophthora sojae]|uniref:Ubiquitin-like protease family profile domain-containing protein n=1 Tax=Phytophthora sojae (strain P6497) TaxID=1094619 RepID=G4ZXF0_PHYSP|nr:hypothetical protein PHYSODRAFT_317582 [Phytophthora sojae]EGZ12566.1 hypothetical protein PHYSODRAFT_317582 [Phytophthora sojae]|eukprot:XP_009532899.1 hypothetical protein PHYSODRAFT_317582 [Phytophthora sojae]
MFRQNHAVVIVDPTYIQIGRRGEVNVNMDTIREIFFGMSDEKVLIPINVSGIHWCCIMIDLTKNDVLLYDSMCSSYLTKVRVVAEMLVAIIPDARVKRYRIRRVDGDLGIQFDSYNCGIYVLVSFELFVREERTGALDKDLLKCLRYRYLCMCM